jgi:DNA-binding FrmR family transcriptional regulator
MKKPSPHRHHDDIARRLKRAEGHLRSIIQMIEDEKPCLDIAQQMHAVEKAITQAKRTLIQDHIDHCLEDTLRKPGKKDGMATNALSEFKEITKYL